MKAGTPDDRCAACGGELASFGVERLRVGGTSGGWHLVFGDWVELTEGLIDVEIHACRDCRRIEFRVPRGMRPEDSGLADQSIDTWREPSLDRDAKAWNPLLGPPEDS